MSEEILINGKKITELSDMFFEYCKLKKENEGLKSLNDFNVQKIEVLKEEHSKLIHKYNDLYEKYREKEIEEPKFKEEIKRYDKLSIKYSQALEEIRKEYTNSIFYQCDKTEVECPCHNCIILGQLERVQNIIKIIDEVLNDRD